MKPNWINPDRVWSRGAADDVESAGAMLKIILQGRGVGCVHDALAWVWRRSLLHVSSSRLSPAQRCPHDFTQVGSKVRHLSCIALQSTEASRSLRGRICSECAGDAAHQC